VIPFSETIFLWQSMVVTVVLLVVSVLIARWSAPGRDTAVTAESMGIDLAKEDQIKVPPPKQPGEWLEHSPLLTVLLVLLAIGWIFYEFGRQSWMIAISNLNTYNFIFIMAGCCCTGARSAFVSVAKSVRRPAEC
jgi:short-chain fatty acids transporter